MKLKDIYNLIETDGGEVAPASTAPTSNISDSDIAKGPGDRIFSKKNKKTVMMKKPLVNFRKNRMEIEGSNVSSNSGLNELKFSDLLETRKEDKVESQKNIEEMDVKIKLIQKFLSESGAKIEKIIKKSAGFHGEQKVNIIFSHPLNDKEHILELTNIQGYSGLNSWMLHRTSKINPHLDPTSNSTIYINPTKDNKLSFEEKIENLIPKRFDK